ncbi:ABC transporter permease subunit [Bacillus sp. RAR_GA_16]|uniref:ABC transporter permease subunit n=1 Tax=Bacillus sp. RAR_GA_16 TaxID=2876774 RepID=UPI001CC9C606|nr:ABC transporter permease subunit [Bacillus sp. RAR_GA_16]MCA0174100.1 ABC transporter permease subunit [Bacillus sp. RAR_GA_16]
MSKSFIRRSAVQFLLTSLGILLIGSLPYLFFNMKSQLEILEMIDQKTLSNTLFLYDTIVFNVNAYVNQLIHTIEYLINGNMLEYYARGRNLPLFPTLWDAYRLSMSYLVGSLIVSVCAGIVLTMVTMVFPKQTRAYIKGIFFLVESLPDIFVILLAQLGVIWLFKQTDLLLFNVTNGFNDQAIFLPIFILSLLPSVYIYKYLLLSFEEEENQLYVELAKGKGINRYRILLHHMFRNAMVSLFYHFKGVFLFALANLLMLELIFDMNGIMMFIYLHGAVNTEMVTLSLYMIFLPTFVFFTLIEWFIERWTARQEGVL